MMGEGWGLAQGLRSLKERFQLGKGVAGKGQDPDGSWCVGRGSVLVRILSWGPLADLCLLFLTNSIRRYQTAAPGTLWLFTCPQGKGRRGGGGRRRERSCGVPKGVQRQERGSERYSQSLECLHPSQPSGLTGAAA